DYLDPIRALRAAAEDRALRFGCDAEDSRDPLPEKAPDAGPGAGRPDAGDEGVDRLAELRPDLARRRLVVRARIDRVRELIRKIGAGLPGDLLGAPDRSAHELRRRRPDDLRAQRLHQ